MDLVLAFIALVCGIGALGLLRRMHRQMQNLNSGLDVVGQTAARARVASDAAAATLARDQDALWRMRSDVDSVRQEIASVREEIEVVRGEIQSVRRELEKGHDDVETVHRELDGVRRAVGSLREDVNDVRKRVDLAGKAPEPSPLPIPPRSQTHSLEALREKLKAEQAMADPDDDDR